MIPMLGTQDLIGRLSKHNNPFLADYYAFYSSWFGGIVTEPHLMLLPIDDHMVHRGDGVFEAIKTVDRHVYLLDAHLKRLLYSAEKIALSHRYTTNEIKDIILTTLAVANRPDVAIRVFLSRGPGSFSVNPYDAVDAQLYVAITKRPDPKPIQYKNGVSVGLSHVACKSSEMAQTKTCNYLPNVLMKKEAVDRGLDYVVGRDPHGYITESATENIVIIDSDGIITHPTLEYILKGTMMIRMCELAREMGFETAARSITVEDIYSAREIMMTGTTLDVLPVVKFESQQIATGQPGIVTQKLGAAIAHDILHGPHSVRF
jgi:4-amino-4-deoxychorismate lyase